MANVINEVLPGGGSWNSVILLSSPCSYQLPSGDVRFSQTSNRNRGCIFRPLSDPPEKAHDELPSINAPRGLPGIDFSDHRNYWAVGYPAVMVTDTSFYRNPNYHKKSDTPDTLDYEKMSQVIIAVFEAVRTLDFNSWLLASPLPPSRH